METLKHLTEERDKKCIDTVLQTKFKEKNLIQSQGTLEFRDEVLVYCIVSINTFLSNKVSDLSFPPTYNILHVVTARGTLSSE